MTQNGVGVYRVTWSRLKSYLFASAYHV